MQQGVVYNAVQDDGNNDKWRPTVYKNTHRMQKVRAAQYESGKSYFLRYITLQIKTRSRSHGSPGNFRRVIYQEVIQAGCDASGRSQDSCQTTQMSQEGCQNDVNVSFNDFIMFFEHFYDLERFTNCRRLYCLRCYSSFRHINDTYRPLACDERMETISQIACQNPIRLNWFLLLRKSEIISEIFIHFNFNFGVSYGRQKLQWNTTTSIKLKTIYTDNTNIIIKSNVNIANNKNKRMNMRSIQTKSRYLSENACILELPKALFDV